MNDKEAALRHYLHLYNAIAQQFYGAMTFTLQCSFCGRPMVTDRHPKCAQVAAMNLPECRL